MSEIIPVTGTRPAVQQDLAIVPHTGRGPDQRTVRLMPVADSILWTPSVGGAHRPAPLMFIAQHTLRKIHDRLASLPNGLGIGLLAGRRYTDSRSAAQFVVIDGALPLPVLPAEDEATDVLARGLGSAAAGIEVLGWYRSHSFSDAALTPSDVDAQSELFTQGSAIVVVNAAGGEVGAVFRHSPSPAWPVEALPFYEWLAEPARNDGPKPTMLTWRNYRPSEPVARNGATMITTASERINMNALLLPDSDSDEEERPMPVVAPAKAAWYQPFVRPAVYVACALAGAVLVAALSAIISSGDASSGTRGAAGNGALDPVAAAAAAALLDRRADTLALAVTAFDDRARMFEARQMTCAGLSRGLQQVEDSWLAYNVARRETLAPFDAPREERDRTLYADVRSVERRFERSSCARP